MIGFDRPLKSEWIYEILKKIEIGEQPTSYYEPFEIIAKELVGKEGKRKARTIIFRSFLYSFQKKRSTIENNPFLEWVHQYSLEELKPLFLVKLLMDYDITRFIISKFDQSAIEPGIISTVMLKKRMVQEYGDRDVVKRSISSFLATLVHFKLLEKTKSDQYKIINRFTLNDDQVIKLLQLYSSEFLHSLHIDIHTIDATLLYFFSPIDFLDIARRYHGNHWEFIRDTNRNQLLMR